MFSWLTPVALALAIYPGVIFVAISLWAGACLRGLVLSRVYALGRTSWLEPLKCLRGSFARRWAVYSAAPNLAMTWAALLGLMAGVAAIVLMPFPGTPLFGAEAVATGKLRPWNLALLWLLIELVPTSHLASIRMIPDPRAQAAASRRLALLQSYLLPQALAVASLAVAAGTTDLLEIARTDSVGLMLLRLGLGVLSTGLLMARSRIGPFNADAGLGIGEPEGLLPGQLLGLLRLSRAVGWMASTTFVVFAFMPLPPSGWATLALWAIYSAAITCLVAIIEAEQVAWHPVRWRRVLWALGTPAGAASLLVALAMRAS